MSTKHEIVINAEYGGFCLSKAAGEWLGKRGIYQKYPNLQSIDEIPRHEPLLVECIKTLGELASERFSKLEIREIESSCYYIDNYDGMESILTPCDFVQIEQENK